MTAARTKSNGHWLHVFLPFAVGYYLSYLLRNANAVIAPELTAELNLSAADLGLLTSAYFLTFASFQIPLGMLLDRFGPRRVEAALLLFAAAGALAFAYGTSIGELAVGRGLMGLGVSACLMAGLKSFSQWYSTERQTSFASAIMIAGGLGAITASVPLELLLPVIGWRGVFAALSGVIVAVAIYIFFTARDHDRGIARSTLTQQWQGVLLVFGSRSFWRFAPQTALFSGGFMAIQGLWVIPWLINVEGFSRTSAAEYLLAIAVAMLASYVATTAYATRLIRRGVTPATLLGVFLAVGWLSQLLTIIGAPPLLLYWLGFGFFMSATQFAYTAVTQRFPLALSGRVSTALNLMAFVGAFSIQWGIGLTIDALVARGWDTNSAYRMAFALLAALQLLTLGWFMVEGKREGAIRSRTPLPPAGP